MMKTIILASFFAAFAFMAMPISTAQAHCGKAECQAKAHKKPCKKELGQKKPCTKMDCKKKDCEKKPCHKKMGTKKPCKKELGQKKPCAKTLQSKARQGSYVDHSAKGSLTFRSGGPISTGGTSSYND